jgi:hypothetical protein
MSLGRSPKLKSLPRKKPLAQSRGFFISAPRHTVLSLVRHSERFALPAPLVIPSGADFQAK